MTITLTGISSMATRLLLADLCPAWQQRSGQQLTIESTGGVDAAKRVRSGEAFDVVILASDAIDQLLADGQLVGTRVDLVHSPVAMAVRAGAAAGKPVGVCGEAAADPLLACVLTGLGVTSLSAAAAAVQGVGAKLAQVTLQQCRDAADAVLAAASAAEARAAALEVLG